MTYLIIFLSLGLPVAIVAIIFLIIGRKSSGVWFWTQLYILYKGKKSTATVIDSIEKDTNLSLSNGGYQYMFTIVMDVVDPDTGNNYRIKRKYMDSWSSPLRNKNVEIPVIIHPTNNEIVIIDFKTIRKDKKESMKQKAESDEDRLDRLMND